MLLTLHFPLGGHSARKFMMELSNLSRRQKGVLQSLYSWTHILLALCPNPSNSDGIHNLSCKIFLSEGSLASVLLENLARVSSWSFVVFPISINPHRHQWHKFLWHLVMGEVYWLYSSSEENDLRCVTLNALRESWFYNLLYCAHTR